MRYLVHVPETKSYPMLLKRLQVMGIRALADSDLRRMALVDVNEDVCQELRAFGYIVTPATEPDPTLNPAA